MPQKILLVEDEAILALSEAKMLKKHGYDVLTAYSGERALEAVESDPEISLILMDIDLGKGMSGTETAEKILRKHNLPIAFLSSHTEPEVVEKTEGITSYGYIVKNSGETVLLASIKMAFRLFEANNRIAQSEEKHRTLFETMSPGVVYHDADGFIVSANPASEKVLGLSFDQMKGKTSMNPRWKMITEDGKAVPGTEHPAMRALRTGEKVGPITRGVFVPEKESYVWLLISATPLFRPGEDKPFQVYATFEDITELKMIEKAYQESEEKYRAAFMTSPDSVNINRMDGLYVDINEGFTALTGYTRKDVIGKFSSEIDIWSIPEDREKLVKGLKEKGEVENLESVFRCKDGSLKTALMSARVITINDEQHILSVTRDITKRKKLEEEAKKANLFLENISDIAYEADTEGNITYVNSATEKITGLTKEELLGSPFPPLFVEEDRDSLMEVYTHTLKGESLENTLRFTSGVICHFTSLPRYDEDGNIIGTFGVARDITERKLVREALAKNEKKYRLLFTHSNDAIFVHEMGENNLPGKIVEVNEQACKLLGYSKSELLQMSIKDISAETNHSLLIYRGQELIEKAYLTFETKDVRSDGVVVPVEVSSFTYYEGGKRYVVSSTRDITERKRMELELKTEKEFFEGILDNMFDLVSITDLAGNFNFVGKSHEILGYNPDNLIGKNVMEFVHPDDYRRIEKEFKNLLESREKRRVEYRYRRVNGEYLWFETHGKILTNEHKNLEQIIFSTRDITERKKLEHQNREREQYLEAILKATPNAIITFDTQNRITEWNHGAEELFHYTREEVIDHNIVEVLGSMDNSVYEEAISFTRKAVIGKGVPPTETLRYTKEGEPLPVITASSPILIDNYQKGVVATYTDISRLKQKEKEVDKLLEEKELLLHEVHHRIKNHMTTISSIISLRAGRVDNGHIREVLTEVQHKIDLMQNIYRLLYTGEDVKHVDISLFLAPLLQDIMATYIDAQSISMRTHIEKVEVSSKQSMPVGIILTELLTNSVKYAFNKKESGEGEIHISVYRDSENPGFLCIEVSDNGEGAPAEVAEKGEYGFGLTLVESYAQQYNGTMSFNCEGGTTVIVVLELQ